MLKALIVDDSLIIRKNISKILTELGCSVIAEAKDGNEAIANFKKYSPDIITMDMTMPDMNGLNATKEIIKIDKNAKIIMITANGQEELAIDCINAGASVFVLKPVNKTNLESALLKVFPDLKDNIANIQSDNLDVNIKL